MNAAERWAEFVQQHAGQDLLLRGRKIVLDRDPHGEKIAWIPGRDSGIGRNVFLHADYRHPDWPIFYAPEGELDWVVLATSVDTLIWEIEPGVATQWAVVSPTYACWDDLPARPRMLISEFDLEPMPGALFQSADREWAENVARQLQVEGVGAVMKQVPDRDRVIAPIFEEW